MRPARALAVVVALASAACQAKKPEAAAAPVTAAAPTGDRILVGHVGSMTGSEATFGQSTDNGIKLAIEQWNAKGGSEGPPDRR